MMEKYVSMFKTLGKLQAVETGYQIHQQKFTNYSSCFIEDLDAYHHVQSYLFVSNSEEEKGYIIFLFKSILLQDLILNSWQEYVPKFEYSKLSDDFFVCSFPVWKITANFISASYNSIRDEAMKTLFEMYQFIMPQRIRARNMGIMGDLIQGLIQKLGIKNFKRKALENKHSTCFAVSNIGQSTDENWKTFPVYMEASGCYMSIRILFSYGQKYYQFSPEICEQYVLEYLSRINTKIDIGCFLFGNNNQNVQFYCKFPYYLVDSLHWEDIIEHLFKTSIEIYKAFAYGFCKIIEAINTPIDLKTLVAQCENRHFHYINKQKGRMQFVPPKKETSSDTDHDLVISKREKVQRETRIIGIIKNDSFLNSVFQINLDTLKDNKIKYKNSTSDMLSDAILSGIFLGSDLRLIMQLLIQLYYKNIIFKFFPSEFLVYSPNSETKVQVRPIKLYKILETSRVPLQKYKLQMLLEQNEFLLDLKREGISNTSAADFVCSSEFKHTNLTDCSLQIGSGGCGFVFKNKLHGLDVAIKIPKKEEESFDSRARRTIKEYSVMKRLSHPHIVVCLGLVRTSSTAGLVMERYKSENLSYYCHKLRSQDRFSVSAQVQKLVKIASAIEFMHLKNTSHLDIKPQNVFLDDRNEVFLGDFGLSRYKGGTSAYKGFTLCYASPEQIKGKADWPSCDIWSFGMTLYAVITGNIPFQSMIRGQEKMKKKKFYKELKNKGRRPEIGREFELNHPKLAYLMRSTWTTSKSRPSIADIRKSLHKSVI